MNRAPNYFKDSLALLSWNVDFLVAFPFYARIPKWDNKTPSLLAQGTTQTLDLGSLLPEHGFLAASGKSWACVCLGLFSAAGFL